MSLTFFLAEIFGWYLLLIGALFLFKRREFVEAATEMSKSKAMLLIVGLMATLCGLMVVLSYVGWGAGAIPTLITILGWAVLLKGLAIIFLPQQVVNAWTRWSHMEKLAYVYAAVTIILGLFLVLGA
jgi:uncharacterized membrane protein